MTQKYIAKFNGVVVGKRTTKDRTYTHAIITAETTPANYYHGKNSKHEQPGVAAWAGRLDLAQKQARELRHLYKVVEIVAAEPVA